MNKNDFETAVGEAAQDAVWKTPHPLTQCLADDDQRREQYLREYQLSVGRQVLSGDRESAACGPFLLSRTSL
jgi:hypothetical protein